VIRLDHTAKPFSADDLLKPNRLPLVHRCLLTRGPMVSMRARPRFVIVLDKFTNQVVEMILTKSNEMVETFSLDRLHKSFHPGVEIGSADRELHALNSRILQG
jgi:hypothetical protein